MNYPFKNAVLAFLQGHSTADELANFLTSQRLNYPLPMYHALMNLLSSHDEPRAYTVLASGLTGDGMTREEEASLVLEEEQLGRCAAIYHTRYAVYLLWRRTRHAGT